MNKYFVYTYDESRDKIVGPMSFMDASKYRNLDHEYGLHSSILKIVVDEEGNVIN